MLIWVFLGGAVLRLIKWLSKSFLPPGPLKTWYRWMEEWAIDSIILGVAISFACWPHASAPRGLALSLLESYRIKLRSLQKAILSARESSCKGQLLVDTANTRILDSWQGPLPLGNRCPEQLQVEDGRCPWSPGGAGGAGAGGPDEMEWDNVAELDSLLGVLLLCGPQVMYVCQLVIVVASAVTIQEIKLLVAQAREQGLLTVIKTSAAKIVPSWIYSLHNHSIKELLDVVEDSAVPVGKRVKALNRLHAQASISCEQSDAICHWGGIAIIRELILRDKTSGAPTQHPELFEQSALVIATLCKSRAAADLIIRDRVQTHNIGRLDNASQSPVSTPVDASAVRAGAVGLEEGRGMQVSLGLKALVGLLEERNCKAKVVMRGLEALSHIAESGSMGAEAVVTTPKATERLVGLLSSRQAEIRAAAAKLVGLIAHHTFSARFSRDFVSSELLSSATSTRSLRERRTALKDMVLPLVAELNRGWILRPHACRFAGTKSCAARALGQLAAGSAENVEVMVKAGAVQALMQILRLRNHWWLFPTDNATLLRLKGDAAFAVAAIAREGDLQRGRLQEAGAIQVLEQLWLGMMHNVDGEVSAAMREEAQVALRAVRGGGESLRTPPMSGSSTPFSSSRASSPGSSPGRGRERRRERLARSITGGSVD